MNQYQLLMTAPRDSVVKMLISERRNNRRLVKIVTEARLDCMELARKDNEVLEDFKTLRKKYRWIWVLFLISILTSVFLYIKAYA